MSGHSKWSTIKHKKAKEDAKRGKVFTKLIREITVVSRDGGGDPAGNARLKAILEKAKAANMPQDNITRAIKKGTGELEGESYESSVYEGYGPYGVAVIVETLTDNKKRTVSAIRHIFSKMGGNLGELGSVLWMFERKGVIRFSAGDFNEDEIMEKVLDFDAEDVKVIDAVVSVVSDIKDLDKLKEGVKGCGFQIESADVEWVAKNPVSLENSDQEERVFKLLESLEDMDDVQHVCSNLS